MKASDIVENQQLGRKAGLNDKQRMFVDLYLMTRDYRKAYQQIYKNNNDEYAYQRGWDLINRNPYVKEYFEAEQKKRQENAIIKTDEILEIYTSIIRNEETLTKDKINALRDVAKINGLFVDKVETTTTIEVKMPDFMLDRREEAKQLSDNIVEADFEVD